MTVAFFLVGYFCSFSPFPIRGNSFAELVPNQGGEMMSWILTLELPWLMSRHSDWGLILPWNLMIHSPPFLLQGRSRPLTPAAFFFSCPFVTESSPYAVMSSCRASSQATHVLNASCNNWRSVRHHAGTFDCLQENPSNWGRRLWRLSSSHLQLEPPFLIATPCRIPVPSLWFANLPARG